MRSSQTLSNPVSNVSLRILLLLGMCVLNGCIYRSPVKLLDAPPADLTPPQLVLRDELEMEIKELANQVGPRSAAVSYASILKAQKWLERKLQSTAAETRLDAVDMNGPTVANVEASIRGTKSPEQIILLGAHYDTVPGSPGANDNASGVAVLLALARRLPELKPERTVRLVFFVNEENPFSSGIQMGSRVYAQRCKERGDNIVAMICIDSLGYYSDAAGSQKYPSFIGWQLPSRGNFVGFGSDLKNRGLLDQTVALFQKNAQFPAIGVALDSPAAGRSDHASFWEQGYPAVLMSDTSEFRDPNYHRRTDTPDHLDYASMARVTEGLLKTIQEMTRVEASP